MANPMPQVTDQDTPANVSRRGLLRAGLATSGGLLLGFVWPDLAAHAAASVDGDKPASLTAWVRIASSGEVVLIVSQAEIGQGISTTLPAILADELGADWASIKTETAPFDPAYRNPRSNWMFTGNSESTQSFYDLMRKTGAAAREMLTQAAAPVLRRRS